MSARFAKSSVAAGTNLRPGPAFAALSPKCDPADVRPHLENIERIAAGDAQGGPIAKLPPSERFHWLVAPSSTIVQPSEVHTGLCEDPAACLDELFERLVR